MTTALGSHENETINTQVIKYRDIFIIVSSFCLLILWLKLNVGFHNLITFGINIVSSSKPQRGGFYQASKRCNSNRNLTKRQHLESVNVIIFIRIFNSSRMTSIQWFDFSFTRISPNAQGE